MPVTAPVATFNTKIWSALNGNPYTFSSIATPPDHWKLPEPTVAGTTMPVTGLETPFPIAAIGLKWSLSCRAGDGNRSTDEAARCAPDFGFQL
jgi:hypothetical protein